MKILIVEDNEDSRNLLTKQLRAYGHEVMAAADGVEALEQALTQPPDIIVSDILMPKMDGYQLCRECKQNEQLKNIPFIFYTATYTREEDEKFALSLGAAAFVGKPTEPDVLVQMLSEIVEKAKSGALASPAVAPLEPSLFLAEHDRRIFAKLEDKVTQLEAEITERKRAEHNLNERVKELQCLYGIANLAERPAITLDELYQEVANLLPKSWQYPEITCSKITTNDKEFRTNNFKETEWKLSAEIKVSGAKAGVVEVCYLEGKPRLDEGPFLKEERLLIDAVAERLGRITERKQAEEELQESEERYRLLAENAKDVIWTVDMNMRPTYMSPSITRLLGYSVEEAMALPMEAVYAPASFETAMKVFAEELAIENMEQKDLFRSRTLELELNRKDGSIVPVEVKFSFIREPDGRPVKILAIARDITERKRAEEELQIAVANLRNSLDNSPLGIRIVTAEGKLLYANQAILDIYGYSSVEELKAVPTKQRYTPESYAGHQERIKRRNLGKPAPPNYEISIVRKDGEIRHLVVSRKEVVWGGETQFQAIYQDITERKQAEEKIKRAAEEWSTTFDSISDLVFINDKDSRLVRVNKAFTDVVKMKPEELIGRPCYEIVHGTNEPAQKCPYKQAIKTKKPAMAEFFEPHLGIHLEAATSPIFNENGEVVASVHVVRDITERKRMEEQLIVTDRLASIGELSSGIAHELNNPLTSVIGFSELLLDRDVPDDVKEDLEVINREAKRTAQVVRNLLTFARKHDTEKKSVDINSIIEKVLELRAYEQKVSNIEVNTRFASDLPEITADGFQLQQVFINIIINAEHFTTEAHRRGTLTITTERVGDIIRASFADDGPGISKENIGHLFDPFFTTKEVGTGTGLGLSISYGIITEHGGRIYAESELGKGATFVVELPISK